MSGKCPECGCECWRDEFNTGAGMQYGPWTCSECGWYEGWRMDAEIDAEIDAEREEREEIMQGESEERRAREALALIKHDTFVRKLGEVVNRYSKENDSNTPDFILAEFLAQCLEAWNLAVAAREEWYGRKHQPGSISTGAPCGEADAGADDPHGEP